MYSISGFGKMIADSIRTQAYAEALRQTIQPDSVVLDIGTGIGIFALLACRYGARKVYAVEPDPVIQVAQQVAVANGYSDRIEFIQALTTEIGLPPADVIVSDIRGVLPLFGPNIPTVIDARRRLLTANGILIPQRDTIWATLVEAPELYSRHSQPWEHELYGFDLRLARRYTINTWGKSKVTPEKVLAEPQIWATLDYQTIESPNIEATLTWETPLSGTAHGLLLWFDTVLAPGIGYSNAPGSPELIYGSAFFPFQAPVECATTETITVTMRANLVGDRYIWQWEAQLPQKPFRQSTFLSQPLSRTLYKRAESYVPTVTLAGKIDALVLTKMSDGETLGAIALDLTEQFPERFPTYPRALAHVGNLSERYS
ncbi:MAG: 50S ribosomal protein L11 methyltransferase [Cyanophyceae cyanobacterium]